MRTMRRADSVLWVLVVFVTLVGVFGAAVWAFAAEGEPGTPWDDVVISFGAVTLAWASAQMGIVQILKAVRIGDKPLLGSAGMVWLANAILGVIGLTIAATQAGVPTVAALIQAIIAVFAASGEYEFLATTGKGSAPTGTE